MAESQAAKAMRLASSTGVTLKEAWAQVKAEAGESPAGSSEMEVTVDSRFLSKEEGW